MRRPRRPPFGKPVGSLGAGVGRKTNQKGLTRQHPSPAGPSLASPRPRGGHQAVTSFPLLRGEPGSRGQRPLSADLPAFPWTSQAHAVRGCSLWKKRPVFFLAQASHHPARAPSTRSTFSPACAFHGWTVPLLRCEQSPQGCGHPGHPCSRTHECAWGPAGPGCWGPERRLGPAPAQPAASWACPRGAGPPREQKGAVAQRVGPALGESRLLPGCPHPGRAFSPPATPGPAAGQCNSWSLPHADPHVWEFNPN